SFTVFISTTSRRSSGRCFRKTTGHTATCPSPLHSSPMGRGSPTSSNVRASTGQWLARRHSASAPSISERNNGVAVPAYRLLLGGFLVHCHGHAWPTALPAVGRRRRRRAPAFRFQLPLHQCGL